MTRQCDDLRAQLRRSENDAAELQRQLDSFRTPTARGVQRDGAPTKASPKPAGKARARANPADLR